MPKELIHFDIARRTAALLADTPFAPCLRDKEDGLLLGAVFHDALFYAVMPGAMRLESLAHRLHGTEGQDTFPLIRMQAAHAAAEASPLPTALLVGMISHLFADATMHPLVWHLTGDYYDNAPATKSLARQRHRALESLMDMVACPHMIGCARYRIHTMLRRCPAMLSHGIPVAELGDMARILPIDAHKQLVAAWRLFATLQWTYSISPLARTLYFLRPYLPRPAAEVACLYYGPQLLDQADSLHGPIDYTHPVTGEHRAETLDALMDNAAGQAAEFCRSLMPTIFDNAPLQIPPAGPSLETGMANVPTTDMLHFSSPPFPDLS